MEIKELLSSFNRNDYQRDNFDSFLSSIKFSYNVPSIHIAGTNGKGSTANYIAAIYQENGYKVGKFTSPWLFKVNEMITINNEPAYEYVDADGHKVRVQNNDSETRYTQYIKSGASFILGDRI